MRSSSSRASRIDWWIIGLRWLMLLSVIPVFLLNPAVGASTKNNLPQTVLIVVMVTAVFNLVSMVLLIFDVPARLIAPAGLIVDTLVTVALLILTGGRNSPLLYLTLFPILTAALRFNPVVDLITTAVICEQR